MITASSTTANNDGKPKAEHRLESCMPTEHGHQTRRNTIIILVSTHEPDIAYARAIHRTLAFDAYPNATTNTPTRVRPPRRAVENWTSTANVGSESISNPPSTPVPIVIHTRTLYQIVDLDECYVTTMSPATKPCPPRRAVENGASAANTGPKVSKSGMTPLTPIHE